MPETSIRLIQPVPDRDGQPVARLALRRATAAEFRRHASGRTRMDRVQSLLRFLTGLPDESLRLLHEDDLARLDFHAGRILDRLAAPKAKQ